MSASMDMLETLVVQIERYPWLYDSTRSDYKDATKKNNSWQAISLAVGMSVEECQRNWRNLRDRYTRELRAMKQPSGSGRSNREEWPLMKPMSFLSAFIRPRTVLTKKAQTPGMPVRTQVRHALESPTVRPDMQESAVYAGDNTTSPADDCDPQVEESAEAAASSSPSPSPVQGSSESSSGSPFPPSPAFLAVHEEEAQGETPPVGFARPPKRRRQETSMSVLQDVLVSATKQMSAAEPNTRPQECVDLTDADTLFLLSLRPKLVCLSARKKHLAHLRIQELLYDITYKED
ncbi:uncharacterized protein LOC135372138 [Ornithodoros turicata]|uniref:uncharacterized protein LOC135372138 n=1 Tax=Ornithodoros turicata TaxID=34597 RepID=UPI00313A39E8